MGAPCHYCGQDDEYFSPLVYVPEIDWFGHIDCLPEELKELYDDEDSGKTPNPYNCNDFA